ncbi:MAG: hypothetical protein R2789_19535 [Microthrixaceae bacterium]
MGTTAPVGERDQRAPRVMFTEWITDQLEGVGSHRQGGAGVPTDRQADPAGQRRVRLSTLRRDNVELVRSGVGSLEPGAVVDSNGDRHHTDVVIWATGFRPNEMLLPDADHGATASISGRCGAATAQGPCPGHDRARFPNFFCLYGPGEGLENAGDDHDYTGEHDPTGSSWTGLTFHVTVPSSWPCPDGTTLHQQ